MARDCNAEIGAAFGEAGLTADEILEMAEEFNAINRAIMAERPWANVQEEMFGHAKKLAKDKLEDALVAKRNAILDKGRWTARLDDLDDPKFAADQYNALTGTQIGSLGYRKRDSVAASNKALSNHWMGSLVAALEKRDLLRLARKGILDLPVARELWELGREGGKPGVSGSKEALQIAKIIHRLQEVMVARSNRAGAFIKRMPGYIVRQSHDAAKIRRTGFSTWYADAQPKVDEGRTFGRFLAPDERLGAYKAIYARLQSGRHMEPMGDDMEVFTGGGSNIAKKMSQHREIHFRSAEDWFAYNQSYGTGSVMQQVVGSIHSTSRNVALMETWGTNPRRMYDAYLRKLDDALEAAGKPLVKARQWPTNIPAKDMWAQVSGEGEHTANAKLAKIVGTARTLQVVAKLGSAAISAIIDTAVMAPEMARHGVPLIKGYASGVTNLISRITDTAEQREVGIMLGAYGEGVAGSLIQRLSGGDMLPGYATEAARLLMKTQGLTFWTDAHREGAVKAFSAAMAHHLDTGFAELKPAYKRMLEAYGINDADWVRLKDAVVDVAGTRYVLPHRLGLDETGDAAGRRASRRERDALASKLETFFSDRMDSAVLSPGARSNALWRGDTQPGTGFGEFLRSIQQFKSYPTEVLTRVWGERIAESDFAGLAAVILAMSVVGTVSFTARDFLKGIAPPDYTDLSVGGWGKTLGRALITGGGASFFGDFVLGESDRYGRNFAASIVGGPTIDFINDAYGLYSAGLKGEDVGAKAFRMLYKNLPFANLWWARTMLDYMFVYQMQELINPGYLRRMERKLASDTGQKFWLRPQRGAPALQAENLPGF